MTRHGKVPPRHIPTTFLLHTWTGLAGFQTTPPPERRASLWGVGRDCSWWPPCLPCMYQRPHSSLRAWSHLCIRNLPGGRKERKSSELLCVPDLMGSSWHLASVGAFPSVQTQVSFLPLTFNNQQVFCLCKKDPGLAQFCRHAHPGLSAKNSPLPFSHW